MGKLIEFTSSYGTEYTIAFERLNYVYGGNLAIEVHSREKGEEWWEPYATLTKNLGGFYSEREAHMDTNNIRDLCDMVIERGWAEVIGTDHSGFCEYPLVRFTEEFLEEICYDAKKGDVL